MKLSIYDFPVLYAIQRNWKKHTIKGGHTIGEEMFKEFFVALPMCYASFDLITNN